MFWNIKSAPLRWGIPNRWAPPVLDVLPAPIHRPTIVLMSIPFKKNLEGPWGGMHHLTQVFWSRWRAMLVQHNCIYNNDFFEVQMRILNRRQANVFLACKMGMGNIASCFSWIPRLLFIMRKTELVNTWTRSDLLKYTLHLCWTHSIIVRIDCRWRPLTTQYSNLRVV